MSALCMGNRARNDLSPRIASNDRQDFAGDIAGARRSSAYPPEFDDLLGGFIGRVERRPDRSGRHRIDANAATDEISQVLRMRVSSRSRRVFKFGMRLLGLLTMD